MKKSLIVAVAKNGIIGRSNGEMPWHSREEFQHFKNSTFGNPIIMGRTTFGTLGKPLKGRLNIVLTRNEKWNSGFEEVKVFNSLDSAYNFCEAGNYEQIFIIGGAQIYKQAMDSVDEMLISIMDFEAEGDVYFPMINEQIWTVESRDKRSEFEILKYVRRKK